MSNTEPTEEQKQAARAWWNDNDLVNADDVARLLAEREAKLQERYDASVAYYKAQADAYHLDVKTLHMHLDTARARERTFKADLDNALGINDTLRARVAELEAKIADAVFSCPGCGRHDFGFFASQIKAACGPCRTRAEAAEEREAQHLARIAELEAEVSESTRLRMTETLHGMGVEAMYQEREAQHLADIKALRAKLCVVLAWGVRDGVRDDLDDLLDDTAHYDDAKAAEGGEG